MTDVQASLREESMIKAIKEGLTVDGKPVMSAYVDKLNEAEIEVLVEYMKAF